MCWCFFHAKFHQQLHFWKRNFVNKYDSRFWTPGGEHQRKVYGRWDIFNWFDIKLMKHKLNSAASELKECIMKRVLYSIFHPWVYYIWCYFRRRPPQVAKKKMWTKGKMEAFQTIFIFWNILSGFMAFVVIVAVLVWFFTSNRSITALHLVL